MLKNRTNTTNPELRKEKKRENDLCNILEEDPEINFMGFGSTADRFNETIPLDSTTSQPSSFLAFPPVPDLPPEQLVEGDDLAQVC